jgi:pumilio family protein 6
VSCCAFVQGHLEEMLTHKHAHRVLMQLLAPDCHRYLPPAIYAIVHPPAKTMLVSAAAAAGGSAGAGLDEDEEEPDFDAEGDAGGDSEQQQDDEGSDGFDEAEEGPSGDDGGSGSGSEDGAAAGGDGSSDAGTVSKQLGESKKDPLLRRQELLGSGPDSVAAALLGLCAEQAVQLLASPVGGEVLVEVARGAAGGLLWQQHQAGVQAVHQALVQQLQQDVQALSSRWKQQQKGKKGKGASSSDAGADVAEPLLTHYFGSRSLRRLLLAGAGEGPEGAAARSFAEQLWQQVLQGQCKHLVGGHAEKVLAALLHCSVGSVEQAAAAELQGLVGGDVQQWSAKFLGPPGQHEQQHQQGKHPKQQQAAGSSKPQHNKQQPQKEQPQKKKHKAH